MSGIARRAVLASTKKNGVRIYHDWAVAVTGIGSCVEPFLVNARPTQTAYDDDDEIRRVDDVIFIDPGTVSLRLSGGDGTRLHGGVQSLTG